MIEKETYFNADEYLLTLKDKLDNFFMKSPLIVTIIYKPDSIIIEDNSKKGFDISFKIDYNKDVKQFIKEIKDYLVENNYPSFKKVNILYKSYTPVEISELILQNPQMTVEYLLEKRKELKIIQEYKIMKIISQRNEIIVKNLTSTKLERYKMFNLPVFTFIKNISEKYSESEISDVFFKKSKFIGYCEESKY